MRGISLHCISLLHLSFQLSKNSSYIAMLYSVTNCVSFIQPFKTNLDLSSLIVWKYYYVV